MQEWLIENKLRIVCFDNVTFSDREVEQWVIDSGICMNVKYHNTGLENSASACSSKIITFILKL